jgi:thioredoxin-dependent peroxiredoxin
VTPSGRLVGLAAVLLASGCKSPSGGAEAAASASAASPVSPAVQVAPPPPLDTSWQRDPGHVLAAGEAAPDFEGIAHTGMRVRLSAFLEKPVVVYFYGEDKSPDATTEARAFRDAWLRLSDKVGMVLGVSAGDRILHRDFATEQELPFLLVADEKHEIARAFGVPLENGREKRVTFIVGKDRKIARVFPEVVAEGHANEVVQALEALK